jgi:outer membrane protein OmpA-like peptidoglycan-associated protein
MTPLALALLAVNLAALQDLERPVALPVEPGMTIVHVVTGDTYQGRDYEFVSTIESVANRNVRLGVTAFVKDDAGKRRWLSVTRTVLSEDLSAARTMILGFNPDDAMQFPGTTAMGPSRVALGELQRTGRTAITVRNYAARPDNTGTIERVERGPVAFPLLVNGLRISVPAVHARGHLRGRGGSRPWEFWFLDHPLQPLTLKVMYGAAGESEVRRPEWSRQTVRIDIPLDLATVEAASLELQGHAADVAGSPGGVAPGAAGALPPGDTAPMGARGGAPEAAGALPAGLDAGAAGESGDLGGSGAGGGAATKPRGGAPIGGAGDQERMGGAGVGLGMGAGLGAGAAGGAGAGIERRLATECRVPVPGIYFEFDSDLLNPASTPWIRSIAELLRRHPDWTLTLEGHTDSIGGARYNHDLSTRRAAALERSLTSEHAIAAARLSTRGFGPDRPLESNSTPEGRARNRRVELVLPCDEPTR